MINPQWLKLRMSRTNFHGPKDVRTIEVQLYIHSFWPDYTTCSSYLHIYTMYLYTLSPHLYNVLAHTISTFIQCTCTHYLHIYTMYTMYLYTLSPHLYNVLVHTISTFIYFNAHSSTIILHISILKVSFHTLPHLLDIIFQIMSQFNTISPHLFTCIPRSSTFNQSERGWDD